MKYLETPYHNRSWPKDKKGSVIQGKAEETERVLLGQEKAMMCGGHVCVLHVNSCYTEKGIVLILLYK